MSFEETPQIQGILLKNQTVILEPDSQHELEQKGFGEMEKNKLILKPFESLYLLYNKRLNLFKVRKNINFDSFFTILSQNIVKILSLVMQITQIIKIAHQKRNSHRSGPGARPPGVMW